jgi:DNA-binding transcriptional LysR family regulator
MVGVSRFITIGYGSSCGEEGAMDVTKLRHLAAVIRSKSFGGAAESLQVSQPALSKSIKALERELGVPLLDRGRFGATPTPFGLTLARHADAIEAELRTAGTEIDALRSARKGSLYVGCGPSEATRLLPLALAQLRARAPGIKMTVLYGLNEALIPMVKHGEIDFARSSLPSQAPDPDLQRIHLHTDTAVVVARTSHPLFARKPLTAKHLVGHQWVLARRQELERRALDGLFEHAALEPPEAAIETTSAVLMKTVVMLSDFLTFLPRELIYWEERAGQLKALNVTAPSWRRIVGITLRSRAALTATVEVAIEELKRAAQSLI